MVIIEHQTQQERPAIAHGPMPVARLHTAIHENYTVSINNTKCFMGRFAPLKGPVLWKSEFFLLS